MKDKRHIIIDEAGRPTPDTACECCSAHLDHIQSALEYAGVVGAENLFGAIGRLKDATHDARAAARSWRAGHDARAEDLRKTKAQLLREREEHREKMSAMREKMDELQSRYDSAPVMKPRSIEIRRSLRPDSGIPGWVDHRDEVSLRFCCPVCGQEDYVGLTNLTECGEPVDVDAVKAPRCLDCSGNW